MESLPSPNFPYSVELWPEGRKPFASEADGELPRLTVYLPSEEHRTGQLVLILPGGGYGMVSTPKEGHRPAQFLNAHGIAAGVLEYRHDPQRHPVPLADAQRGMRMLRSVAARAGMSRTTAGVLGFSAGGHLAGCLATQPEVEEARVDDEVDGVPYKPDFAALIYPVVSLTAAFSHFGSRDNLLGGPGQAEMADRLSLEKAVGPATPPMFLAHAQNDEVVPVANALALAEALTRHGVEADLHVFAKGGHGFGMAANHGWGALLLAWLKYISLGKS